MDNYDLLNHNTISDILFEASGSAVLQLDNNTKEYLKQDFYVVQPKAEDGCRAFLLCEPHTGNLYQIFHSHAELISKENHNAPDGVGFLLETEVVTNSCSTGGSKAAILACDILCYVECLTNKDTIQKSLFAERYSLMESLVRSLSIPNLKMKPTAPADLAWKMWKTWNYLPYSVDGLIFIPSKCTSSLITTVRLPMLKWKPLSKVILNVALGDVFEHNDYGSHFIAHLFNDNNLLHERSIPNSIKDIIPTTHTSFYAVSKRRSLSFSENNNKPSCEYFETFSLKDDSGTPRSSRSIVHDHQNSCLRFSELDTASFESAPTKMTSSLQRRGSEVQMVSKIFSVWIPSKYSSWAKCGIAQVELLVGKTLNEKVHELKFKRILYDKNRAHSLSEANEILGSYFSPTKLRKVEIKTEGGTICKTVADECIYIQSLNTQYRNDNFSRREKEIDALFLSDVILPTSIEQGILSFLSIPDLIKSRTLSNLWRSEIDKLSICRKVKEEYFQPSKKIVHLDSCHNFVIKRKDEWIPTNFRSVALFMHMGGHVEELKDVDQSDSDSDYAIFGRFDSY